nr:hypothetical protein [Candidatus Sigynarchaeota archaeon]
FDYLIERGLIKVLDAGGFPPEKISPVITKDDFVRWSEPGTARLEIGNEPLFKLHGSFKNIITGALTKETLITTISALGKGKGVTQTFSIETFKKPAINSLMHKRCLIVLGYSGSDDFDIGPTLKELPDLSKIIWINHSMPGSNVVYKVKRLTDIQTLENKAGVYPLLAEIRHDVDYDVYRLNVNTELFIREHVWPRIARGEPFQDSLVSREPIKPMQFKDFVSQSFSSASELERIEFATSIYSAAYDVAGYKRTVERAMAIAQDRGDDLLKAKMLEKKVAIFYDENDMAGCLQAYDEADALYAKLGMVKARGRVITGAAKIHVGLGNIDIAMVKLDEALSIAEETRDDESIARINQAIG